MSRLCAQFLVNSGSTEMAHGPDDSTRVSGTCNTVGCTMDKRRRSWCHERQTVTFVVTDVLKVALSFSSLANRMQVTFGLQRGSIQRKEGVIEMDRLS